MKKFSNIILCLAMLLSLFVMNSSASIRTEIDVDAECSLELVYKADDVPFGGLEIKLFYVGSVSPSCEFALDGDFSEYAIDISSIQTQDEWRTVAETLSSYAIADSVSPTAISKTDADGRVKFDSLNVGVYLVLGVTTEYEGEIFTFETFLSSLPGADSEGYPLYDVIAYPKHTSYIPEPEKIELSVIKLWKDNGNENRPKSIDVDIFKNGEFFESKTLSSDNNWKYVWTADDDGSKWTVVERNIPENYTVEIVNNDYSFAVTNTFVAPPDIPTTGDTSTMWQYVLLMFVAGGILLILAVNRRPAEL